MRRFRLWYAKSWMMLADGLILVSERALPFATNMALAYCRLYGHTYVTYLDGKTYCTLCELDKDMVHSIEILEEV